MMDPRVISASTRVFDALLPAGDVRVHCPRSRSVMAGHSASEDARERA